MKKVQLFHIMFIMFLLSGCTKDILDNGVPINKDGSIAFYTDSILTRGTPQDTLTAYDKVNLIAYSHPADKYADGKSLYRETVLNKESSSTTLTWDYNPHMFWPNDRDLSFLAYAIESNMTYATASNTEGVFIRYNDEPAAPAIEYFTPTQVEKQPDLLVTAQLNHPKASSIQLEMKHALACVSFCATGPTDMKVKQLRIKNVCTKGSFQLDDPDIKWTLDQNSKNLVVLEPGMNDDNLEENPTNGNYLMTTNGYLMMLPQKLTDATIDVTYWKGTQGTEKLITYALPTTIAWESGKKYIYKFGEDTEVVVYYEMYTDGSIGLHTNNSEDAVKLTSKLDETKEIKEAGYGVLTKSRSLSSETPTIKIGNGTAIKSKKIAGVSGDYNLYAINQTTAGTTTFVLPTTITPVSLYFDGNNVESYKIIPHVAKGVSQYNLPKYSIRTPQQMKNLSALTTSDPFYEGTSGKTFLQERDLDFSKAAIGGGTLSDPVVDDQFGGTYEGKYNGVAKVISNVVINAPSSDFVGLFSITASAINDITLKSSSITGKDYVGGITGKNYGMYGAINRPRVIGTDSGAGKMMIKGVSTVGGIVGLNNALIAGNTEFVAVTETTVAEVSGWVDIIGSGNNVGGIVGDNNGAGGKINKVLVNGVNVENSTDAKINIRGVNQIGGIVGMNWAEISGNVTGDGNSIKEMPDLAGLVEISGVNWVGGITGWNASTGKLNSVNIRLGRATPMRIIGSGLNVGGIAGQNDGTLGTESTKTFISTRGNIEISGTGNVGGIVGVNAPGATLQNCFVYNFFTQGLGKKYFAPKITCSGGNAGGIVGNNSGTVNSCSVFTAEQNTQLTISAVTNAGGICGLNNGNSSAQSCSVVGKVLVTLPFTPPVQVWENSIYVGGICGNNKPGTHIKSCWIGSSDGYNIIGNAIQNRGLVITPPDEPGVQPSYGTPTVTGKKYVGGIVGLNDGGIIENITLSDNVIIGAAETNPNIGTGSDWVGGIAGGNTPSYDGLTQSIIRNCKVINEVGKKVVIQGATSLGGIVGLNNGVVDNCEVSGTNGNPLTISGLGTIGGIVGQIAGHTSIISSEAGNDFSVVKNCKVTGYVTLNGDIGGWDASKQVGGIIGLLGPTTGGRNNLAGCVVKGTTTNSIIVTSGGPAGGVVGKNSGNILSCDVYNTQITSKNAVAGGITGHSFCNSAYPATAPKYHADINDCRVYSATIAAPTKGMWIGLLDTGALTGSVTFGRTNLNYVFTTPAIGKTTTLGTVTSNCTVSTPPVRP